MFIALLSIFMWIISILIIIIVIRHSIDSSKTSRKLDILIDEIRSLRKEIKDHKHIIDKRV